MNVGTDSNSLGTLMRTVINEGGGVITDEWYRQDLDAAMREFNDAVIIAPALWVQEDRGNPGTDRIAWLVVADDPRKAWDKWVSFHLEVISGADGYKIEQKYKDMMLDFEMRLKNNLQEIFKLKLDN